MKFKLNKSQWKQMGEEAGWMKKAQLVQPSSAQPQPATQQQIGTQFTPAQQPPAQPKASVWTFNRLMQDPNFKKTFQMLLNLKANEKNILQYWQSNGIPYRSIPEILEVLA